MPVPLGLDNGERARLGKSADILVTAAEKQTELDPEHLPPSHAKQQEDVVAFLSQREER